MNSKTNDLLSTAYESAFGVKQPRTVVNKGFSEQSVSRSAVEIQRFLVGRVMTFDLQARVWFGHVFLITLLRMFWIFLGLVLRSDEARDWLTETSVYFCIGCERLVVEPL